MGIGQQQTKQSKRDINICFHCNSAKAAKGLRILLLVEVNMLYVKLSTGNKLTI